MEKKGLYVLFVHLPEEKAIRVGAMGPLSFRRGFYAYIGSAMAGLRRRLLRYTRGGRRKKWHIDYLLPHAPLKGVLAIEGEDKKYECLLAERLRKHTEAIPHFGASDCRCGGHLFYSEDWKALKTCCSQAVKALGLKASFWPTTSLKRTLA